MQISLLLMQQIAQLFLVLLMGYAVVKTGLLKASDSKVLSVVFVYLVMPCVVLNAFQIKDTPEIRTGLLYSMGIAVGMHVVFLLLNALFRKALKLDAVEQVNIIYSNAAAQLSAGVSASAGCSAGHRPAALGSSRIPLDPGRQVHPDDGLPFCHYPRLCNSHLHGTAL